LKEDRAAHKKRLGSPGFGGPAARSLKRVIAGLDREIRALEKAFLSEVSKGSLAERHQHALSVPGAGPALARCAVCELPEDLEQWTQREIASYAGLAPMDDSSGRREGRRRLSRHGCRRLKAALYMPALTVVRRE